MKNSRSNATKQPHDTADPVNLMKSRNRTRFRAWMEIEEWTPLMATHILLNLDPENTEHPTGRQGWCCSWLYRGDGFPLAKKLTRQEIHSRDQNLSMKFHRMHRLANKADDLKIRKPRQWLAWAENMTFCQTGLRLWVPGAVSSQNAK